MVAGTRSWLRHLGIPWAEALLYSPAYVFPALVLAVPLFSNSHHWLASKMRTLPEQTSLAWLFIVLAVAWRPLLGGPLRFLAMITFGIVSRSPGEVLGRNLLSRLKQGRPIDEIAEVLRQRTQEGNVDWEHLETALWCWIAARHLRSVSLEALARQRSRQLMASDDLAYAGSKLEAWRLRAELAVRPLGAHLIPPW